jgi:hypothetical protein
LEAPDEATAREWLALLAGLSQWQVEGEFVCLDS